MANYYPQGMQQQAPFQSTYYPEQSLVKVPSNPIGEEGIRTLMATKNKLFFDVSKKDVWDLLCYHTHNGDFQMDQVDLEKNIWKCRICGEHVNMGADISSKDLEAAVDLILIAWQQVKFSNFGSVSTEIMYDYAQSLAVIKKFPHLFNFVVSNFKKNTVQSQQTNNNYQNLGQATYNAIHNTNGFGYNPVYNAGAPTMIQSQAIGNPFQPTIQQPVMYVPQQQIIQPQYQMIPPQQQQYQQPIQVAQQYQQPQQQPQMMYSYQQQPQFQPQQPPMPMTPPPAANGTVVPEQQPQQPYPPKDNNQVVPGKTEGSVKRALGFNL